MSHLLPTARGARTGLALGLAVATLAGCGFQGANSLPLPGGKATGGDAYSVTIEFNDVLDLVRQSSVKVNDVTVGSVDKISLDGYTAKVKVNIEKGVTLPENARASLRQTSLLGEKFVSLDQPVGEAPQGALRNGDVIPLSHTTRSAEIEEVLGALSLVLNGGSLEQLQVINRELVAALSGRESQVRDVLKQLDVFIGGLDEQKSEIVRALNGLDKLTARLADQRQILAEALRDLPTGARVLESQRTLLVQVLQDLDKLGNVAVHVIRASQQNTVADLRALQPILGQLAAAGANLPKALELLLTYPFPRTIDQGIRGDYANLFITADVDLRDSGTTGVPIPGAPDLPVPVPTGVPTAIPSLPVPGAGGTTSGGGVGTSRPVPTKAPSVPSLQLPGVPKLRSGLPLSAGSGDLLGLLLGGLS